jgi:hypothetical protein
MSSHISYHATANASHTSAAITLHHRHIHHWPLHLLCRPQPGNIFSINTLHSKEPRLSTIHQTIKHRFYLNVKHVKLCY